MEPTKEQVWTALSLPAGMEDVKEKDDLMTVEEFIKSVTDGSFIDYDGHGHWATETKELGYGGYGISSSNVYPSQILSGKKTPPQWATHVVWYNR